MNEDRTIMPRRARWIALCWALQGVSMFLFSAYIDDSWGTVPPYLCLFVSLLITQEAMLKVIIRHNKEDERLPDDEML